MPISNKEGFANIGRTGASKITKTTKRMIIAEIMRITNPILMWRPC
jgi:hypothetical protein